MCDVSSGGGGGGGGGGGHSENFNILGGFKKMIFLGGRYEDFVDIIWGHHKIRLYLGVLLCILGPFLKVKVQSCCFFFFFFFFFWGGGGGAKYSNILECLKFLISDITFG